MNNYKEIEIPGKGWLIVDEDATDIKIGNWVYSVDIEEYLLEDEEDLEYANKYHWKIIASTFKIDKSIPLYKREDSVEDFSDWYDKSNYPRCENNSDTVDEMTIEDFKWHYMGAAYDAGKAAQQKIMFSEDDLIKTIELTVAACNEAQKKSFGDLEIDMDNIIQSLKNKPIEFEYHCTSTTMEQDMNCPCFQIGGNTCQIKTTIDEEGWKWVKIK